MYHFSSLTLKDDTKSDSAIASGEIFHSLVVLRKEKNRPPTLSPCLVEEDLL